ncbi:hypothetical protein I3842_15G099600 [Carya illinoinensis]|uniref:Uncharacterized protein n=1 Tax=Carya illinoinensis TaxID=32201 RepID=A0A922A7L9_CARIL|nr:hypothetical protein I3842_15G099600 [Carya illinoinensis]
MQNYCSLLWKKIRRGGRNYRFCVAQLLSNYCCNLSKGILK